MAKTNLKVQGDGAWNSAEKINAELLAFTYGSFVVKLIREMDSIDNVNRQIEVMGYNIGRRLIDDFLAKSVTQCESLRDMAETIAKVGIKMYLGVGCEVTYFNEEEKIFVLALPECPLTEFVELNEEQQDLVYLNIVCGVIRGALEMLHRRVECHIIKDALKGDETNEIRVRVLEVLLDEYKSDD